MNERKTFKSIMTTWDNIKSVTALFLPLNWLAIDTRQTASQKMHASSSMFDVMVCVCLSLSELP